MTSATISLRGVTAQRKGSPFVLTVDALEVPPGRFLAVTGESGSGKSTLLDVMAGLLPASAGQVQVAGLDLRSAGGRRQVRRRGLYVAQSGSTIPYLTALENVLMAGAIAGLKKDERAARSALDQLGMGEYADRPVAQLSGGQRQRAGLASAIYRRSTVIWADEPTSALDPTSTMTVFGAFQDLAHQSGTTVVCVSHDVDTVSQVADEVIHVEAGRLRMGGRYAAATDEAALLVGGRA